MADFVFTGWISQIDNSKNYHPFKFSARDQTNQTLWFGLFDVKTGQMIEQGGIGSGPWTITYAVKPWIGDDGKERFNNNVKTIAGGTVAPPVQQAQPQQPQQAPPQAPVPVPQAPAPQVPVPQTPPPPVQQDSSRQLPNWVVTLSDRDRSIIRQVVFKEVPDKHNLTLEEIARLTDEYEAIVLCSFEPDPPPSNAEFIQQSF